MGRVIDPEIGPFISQDEDKRDVVVVTGKRGGGEERERSLVAGKRKEREEDGRRQDTRERKAPDRADSRARFRGIASGGSRGS